MSNTFPEPKFIETNGIRMAVYDQGEGFPVVFSHGFPELAYSWRHQLPALANAGFRAIAPDQRGYGLTDKPKNVEDYDIINLCGDLVGLLDALDIEKAVFCGHDWGGFVVWQMPLRHPDRVAGVIGVNTPFMPRAPMDPIELMRQAIGEEMYIVQFQEYGVADAKLEKDVEKSFRMFFRKPQMTLEEFNNMPQEMRTLNLLDAIEAEDDGGELVCSDEELQIFIDAFKAGGFTGPINWYRNFTRNWQLSEQLEDSVPMPSLMISAANDVVLQPSMADGMENYVPDLEKHVIADCGHWTQQEKPEELNALLIEWLKKRFG